MRGSMQQGGEDFGQQLGSYMVRSRCAGVTSGLSMRQRVAGCNDLCPQPKARHDVATDCLSIKHCQGSAAPECIPRCNN